MAHTEARALRARALYSRYLFVLRTKIATLYPRATLAQIFFFYQKILHRVGIYPTLVWTYLEVKPSSTFKKTPFFRHFEVF